MYSRPAQLIFLLSTLLFLPLICLGGAPFSANVIGITDGDTLKVLDARKQQIKIRLAEIDTPEKKQPWGQKAKQALSELTFQKTIRVKPITKDRYGRLVAHIVVDGMNVNRELVRTGNAWVYRKYMEDVSLLDLEAEARDAKRGLWGLTESQRVPPWEWRKKK